MTASSSCIARSKSGSSDSATPEVRHVARSSELAANVEHLPRRRLVASAMGLRGRDGIILRPGYRTAMRSIELPMPVLFDQHVMRLGHYKRAFPPTRLNVLPRGHIMPSVKRAITVHGGGRGFRRKFHPGPGQHVNPGRKAQVRGLPPARHDRRGSRRGSRR